jgi:hypothetical protein
MAAVLRWRSTIFPVSNGGRSDGEAVNRKTPPSYKTWRIVAKERLFSSFGGRYGIAGLFRSLFPFVHKGQRC